MKIALICTQGGHLTETLQILDAFEGHEIFFVTHYSSRDKDILAIAPAYFSQSIDARLGRLLLEFPRALTVLRKEKPDLVFSMGAEIALPYFFWARLFGMKTMYIESWCRVEQLSITGKLSYPWVDEFWVQWPQLLSACGPKAKYMGSIE
jgi:beta-1,4-N-acetylglucosaminyltransferase